MGTRCPKCQYKINFAGGVPGQRSRQPTQGDLLICSGCYAVLTFAGQQLRAASLAEQAPHGDDLARAIKFAKQQKELEKGPSFQLGHADDGAAFIKCLRCGSVSYNKGDIRERFCGKCHGFHEAT